MKSFLKMILLSMLISFIMLTLFYWGYGTVHTGSQYIVYIISSFGIYMLVENVIDVLNGVRNPLKTRKICKYCDCRYPMKPKQARQADMRVLYGHTLHVWQSATRDLDFDIKYCPMCGRKLEVEDE